MSELAVGPSNGRATCWFELRNVGSATWYRGGAYPVRLGLSNPLDRFSAFYDAATWLSQDRPTALDQGSESVVPGQVGRFTFTLVAPRNPGTYTEYFRPVAEGLTWFNDLGLYFRIVVTATVPRNDYFGFAFVSGVEAATNDVYSDAETRYSKGKAAGARWTRWPLYWHNIEKGGSYDFSAQDSVVIGDVENGFSVDAILMGSPPQFTAASFSPRPPFDVARKYLLGPSSSAITLPQVSALSLGDPRIVPRGLYKPVFVEEGGKKRVNSENSWASFVGAAVRRYMPGGEIAQQRRWADGQGVRVWELWNEPDLLLDVNGQKVRVYWSGTKQDYYMLLKVGYQTIKSVDPQATVLFAGLAYWSDKTFLSEVLDYIVDDPAAAQNNYFFDVLPLHFYVSPYHLYDYALWARNQLAAKDIPAKPIWINESNIPVCGDSLVQWFDCPSGGSYFGSQEVQQAYVVQAYALALAGGVQRSFIFQLYDDGIPPPEYYGLVRNNHTTRPAYDTYRLVATYFDEPASVSRVISGQVDQVSMYTDRYGKITVLWNRGEGNATAAVTATMPTATLIDVNGNAQLLVPSGGLFSVALPPASHRPLGDTSNDVGGSPYLLVESVYTDLSSRVQALQELSEPNFTVSWGRLDQSGRSALFDVQYREGASGFWQDWLGNTSATSAVFDRGRRGQSYYFRVHAKDAQGTEPYPSGDGDAHTTIATYLTGRVLDPRGRPQPRARVSESVQGRTVQADAQGSYLLSGLAPGGYRVSASLWGYSTPPQKLIGVSEPITFDLFLLPSPNLVSNGGFEQGLEGWATSGTVTRTTAVHSGSYGLSLRGGASIQQAVQVLPDMHEPTLSFAYRQPSTSSTGTLTVALESGTGSATTAVALTADDAWHQGWLDLGALSGPATLRFSLTGNASTELWLDEVGLGPASTRKTLVPMVSVGYAGSW